MSFGFYLLQHQTEQAPENVAIHFRIAGAAMMAPVINYRWPGFPQHLSEEAYRKQQPGDQWALRVAYYAPWLLHWWMKQSWLPSSTVIKGTTHLPNRLDSQLREYVMKNSGMFEEVGATPVSFFYFLF